MARKKALITGITGQDGAYLAEFLLRKDYEVHGIKRRTSLFNTDRIDHLLIDRHEGEPRLFLHHGDMTDASSLVHIIEKVEPDESTTSRRSPTSRSASKNPSTPPMRTRSGSCGCLRPCASSA